MIVLVLQSFLAVFAYLFQMCVSNVCLLVVNYGRTSVFAFLDLMEAYHYVYVSPPLDWQ